jgi:hypothetical protein
MYVSSCNNLQLLTHLVRSESQRQLAPPAPAQPQFCPHLQPRKGGYLQVYGYPVNIDWLVDYAVQNNLETIEEPHNAKYEALGHILDLTRLAENRIVTVQTQDGPSSLIALAGNYKKESMWLPPDHKVKKLQEALGRSDDPQWYLKI